MDYRRTHDPCKSEALKCIPVLLETIYQLLLLILHFLSVPHLINLFMQG